MWTRRLWNFLPTHRKTHNAGVFDAYTPEMRACRSSHIITGLPDAYGRGRIIGDYRRVALYGVDRLIEDKKAQQKDSDPRDHVLDDVIREREELSEQIKALEDVEENWAISTASTSRQPANNVREAIQWTVLRLSGGCQGAERRGHVAWDAPPRSSTSMRSAT